MTDRNFVPLVSARITMGPKGVVEIHLDDDRLEITGGHVTFSGEIRETGNWLRLGDDRTRAFVRTLMKPGFVTSISVSSRGALVRHGQGNYHQTVALRLKDELAVGGLVAPGEIVVSPSWVHLWLLDLPVFMAHGDVAPRQIVIEPTLPIEAYAISAADFEQIRGLFEAMIIQAGGSRLCFVSGTVDGGEAAIMAIVRYHIKTASDLCADQK